MITHTTEGVKIIVETFYRSEESFPVSGEFAFAYRITIENQSDHTVKLLRRHWEIFDSNGTRRVVEGQGIVGNQPVINPEEGHTYVSGCSFRTEIGKMHGYYIMERVLDGRQIKVRIPEFLLIAPFKLN
jgi:ApaG protein